MEAALEAGDRALASDRPEEAERSLTRALDLAEQLGDDALVAQVQLHMGEVRLRRGDHGAARASAVAALEIFGRLSSLLDRARGCHLLGRILRESGAAELAERRLQEAAEIAFREGDPLLECEALGELALLHRSEGRIPEALRSLARVRGLLGTDPELCASLWGDHATARKLLRVYPEVARDLFPTATPSELAYAARVAQIADGLATEVGLGLPDRLGVVFTASIRAFTQPLRRDGSAHPAGARRGLEPEGGVPEELLPGSAERAEVELGGSGAEQTRSVADQIPEFAAAVGGAEIRDSAAELRERVLTAAGALGRWDKALIRAAERLDWASLLEGHTPAQDTAAPLSGAAAPGLTTTILVVDDDPEVRTILSDYFHAKGYRVETTESGDGLFSILGRVKPDLLLLDLMLPGRDGRTILDRIRGSLSWSHVPVIVITGIHDAAEATRTLRAGADDWIEKPLDLPTLHARIERLLSLRRALHEAEKHRARQELLLEIIRELTGSLDTDHLLNRLVRRIAEATGVAKCSLVLTDLAEGRGTLASAYDNPTVHGLQLDLARYPEIGRALETGEPVVISDLYSDPLFDDVRRKWATGLNVRSSAVIPLVVDDCAIGVFLIRTTLDEPPLDRSTIEFATQVTEAAGKALEYARLFERISTDLREAERKVHNYRSLSLTDPLTSLANRAGLESKGTDLFLSARAFDHPLSVIMLDLDNFKDLNDAHGHAAGDEVLRRLGAALSEFAEEQDLVARYGGDEFCMVLPYKEVDDATRLARIIGERIQRIRVADLSTEPPRASIGVAAYPLLPVPTLNDLIARADEALYRAKSAGGGHVQVAFGAVEGRSGREEGPAEPASAP